MWITPINDVSPAPIFQHVLRIEPLRCLKRRAADKQIDRACKDFVGPVDADDFEWEFFSDH
jgi:hypothetical protein